jgi:sortase A
MTRAAEVLLWLERTLLAVGIVLGVWAGLHVAEARYFASLPIPGPRPAVARLPGEGGNQIVEPTAGGDRAVRSGDWIARLDAPTVHLSATVVEGSDDETLGRAAGHIEDTALPGDGGNVGIAAHRDTIFRPVRSLKLGDPLVLTTADRVFEYRIGLLKIVNPEDVYVLDPTPNPTLTLVTCYPFTFIGHAPQRFIVQAQLVAERPR